MGAKPSHTSYAVVSAAIPVRDRPPVWPVSVNHLTLRSPRALLRSVRQLWEEHAHPCRSQSHSRHLRKRWSERTMAGAPSDGSAIAWGAHQWQSCLMRSSWGYGRPSPARRPPQLSARGDRSLHPAADTRAANGWVRQSPPGLQDRGL